MNSRPARFLAHLLVLALGVVIAARVVPGIHYDDGASLLVAVIVLSLVNTFLRPVLLLFTLPFILLTMGLGILVINAFLFLCVGYWVSGFYVDGFWSAVGGSVVVSLTGFVMNGLLRSGPKPPVPPAGPGGAVIDI